MSAAQSGAKNGQWKGGRVTDPRGYVLIRVGKDHPLADCRGYAYEHRLIAAQSAPLLPGQIVHHDDEQPGNNGAGNLKPLTRAEHRRAHRRFDRGLRNPGEPNTAAACACGCGSTFERFDASGRPRRFVSGHNVRQTHG